MANEQTPIRIYDLDLTLLGQIGNYESLIFQRSLYGIGKFTLTLEYNINNADLLAKNKLISVGKSENKVGIIRSYRYKNKGNSAMLIIQGYELKWVLKSRITIPTAAASHQSFTNTEAETIIKDVVSRNLASSDADVVQFKYPSYFTIAADSARGDKFDFNTRYKKLNEELEAFGELAEMGTQVTVDFDTGDWIFDVIVGVDRTYTTGASPVIFSNKYGNLKEQDYIDSDIDSANYAVVGGQGDGAARTIVETGTSDTGVEMNVIFVDARDLNTNDELTARGQEKLAKNASITSFEGVILPIGTFEYETDYDLGDEVTIQNDKLGVSIDRRIENIIEYYTAKGFNVELIFGKQQKTIDEMIANMASETAIN